MDFTIFFCLFAACGDHTEWNPRLPQGSAVQDTDKPSTGEYQVFAYLSAEVEYC